MMRKALCLKNIYTHKYTHAHIYTVAVLWFQNLVDFEQEISWGHHGRKVSLKALANLLV